MADFRTSTHREKWIFTTPDLAAKYEAANRRAIHTLEKYGATRMEVDEDGTLLYRETPVNPSAEKHSRPKPLTIEEERFLRIFYEKKLQEVCGAFYFPHKIQATALIYFKRFYLQWSVMEHHPKDIMFFHASDLPVLISTDLDLHGYWRPKHFMVALVLTCIYAACKIEENHVSAEELGKGISQDHQVILNSEMLVLQSLEFDLIVYAPYRSVEGFAGAMMEFCGGEDDQMQMLKATAVEEVDKIMLTDAPLLFPPGQLALAALRQSNEVHRVLDFESYFGSEPLLQNSSHSFAELNELLSAIDSLVKTYKFPSEKDMKHINRKLKSCWGLSSHDDSKKREKKSKQNSKHNVNDTENGISFT